MPASRNESQTADPATAPASPSSAKMPAPTIAPMPRKAAPRTLMAAVLTRGAPLSKCRGAGLEPARRSCHRYRTRGAYLRPSTRFTLLPRASLLPGLGL